MTKAQALWGRRCLDNGGQENPQRLESWWNQQSSDWNVFCPETWVSKEFKGNCPSISRSVLYQCPLTSLATLSQAYFAPLLTAWKSLPSLSSELTDPIKICHKHIKFNMPKPNPLYPPLQVFILSLFKSELLFTSLPCSTLLRHLFLQEDFLFSTSEHVLHLSLSTYHIKLPTSVFSRSCCTALCTAPGTLQLNINEY